LGSDSIAAFQGLEGSELDPKLVDLPGKVSPLGEAAGLAGSVPSCAEVAVVVAGHLAAAAPYWAFPAA